MLRETTSQGRCELVCPSRTLIVCVCFMCLCVFITAGPITKLCVGIQCFITAGPITKLCAWGEEESGGHVL